MKYIIHFKQMHTAEFDSDTKGDELKVHALWVAKNYSGSNDVEVVQVRPHGTPSSLGRDLPETPGPGRPLPPPPMPPLGMGGDMMLARAA